MYDWQDLTPFCDPFLLSIVQAVPVFIGGFSSPVRTNFGPTPSIQSDDNVNFAFFPNPQTGEFYNGLPNGCGNSTASCGKESGDALDNPFAYVPIEVTAGGRVDHINMFLNTSTSGDDLFTNPGLDFCGLGDVDGNGTVNQSDILAVVQAKAAFDAGQSFNRRADLNEDGSITFLDIDSITDIVTLPRPFRRITPEEDINRALAEIKRGLAPFEAICTAAAQGSCRIQAPVEATPEDKEQICATAKTIGCQVIGCP